MSHLNVATFGGGCFWCIDAPFRRVKGVHSVRSGYAGGTIEAPTYQDICRGDSGHAEVVEITFDEAIVSFSTLLEMFFTLHDPTQLNQQGNDIGTQYRSVVFYHNDEQKHQTLKHIDALQSKYRDEIVTEVSPIPTFYPAEQYHQDYFNENPQQGYCSFVIAPKMAKFEQRFASQLSD